MECGASPTVWVLRYRTPGVAEPYRCGNVGQRKSMGMQSRPNGRPRTGNRGCEGGSVPREIPSGPRARMSHPARPRSGAGQDRDRDSGVQRGAGDRGRPRSSGDPGLPSGRGGRWVARRDRRQGASARRRPGLPSDQPRSGGGPADRDHRRPRAGRRRDRDLRCGRAARPGGHPGAGGADSGWRVRRHPRVALPGTGGADAAQPPADASGRGMVHLAHARAFG